MDRQHLSILRNNLQANLIRLQQIIPSNNQKQQLPDREQREMIRLFWIQQLDVYLTMDKMESKQRSFWKISQKNQKQDQFAFSYALFLQQYRYALEFLQKIDQFKTVETILNSPFPNDGIPGQTLSAMKYEYLNMIMGSRFASWEVLAKAMTLLPKDPLYAQISQDRDYIWQMSKGQGEKMTVENGLTILKQAFKNKWLPLQTNVANWMGDTKVYRKNQALISDKQIQFIKSNVLPGDIFLERREWYLTNIGIPGFWTHAALNIGSPKEREELANDPEAKKWLKDQGFDSFQALLLAKYPKATKKSNGLFHQQKISVIEAVAEGVIFTSLNYTAHCDSFAALRPNLTPLSKLKAISQAFSYFGRPYDYDFDFVTDHALVCTELVYKSFEGMINIPLEQMMGHPIVPANQYAQLVDREFSTKNAQLQCIVFLDGNEKNKNAIISNEHSFRKSWQRPKWHIILPQQMKE